MKVPKLIGAMFVMAVITCLCFTAQAATETLILSFGPQSGDPALPQYLLQAATTIWNTGTLPQGARQSPSDARLATTVTPERLMTSPLNGPTQKDGIFDTNYVGYYGTTLYGWYYVVAGQGEIVAMATLTNRVSSTEPNNLLAQTTTLDPATSSYSPTSPGEAPDGSTLNGQSSATPAKRYLLAFGSKSFTVIGPTNVNNDHVFFAPYPYWAVTFQGTAGVTGGSSPTIMVSRTIQKPLPALMLPSVSNGLLTINTVANGDVDFHVVESTTNIIGGWAFVGELKAGGNLNLDATGSQLFLRYRPSPSGSLGTQGLKFVPQTQSNPMLY